jgi:hypothetical protein
MVASGGTVSPPQPWAGSMPSVWISEPPALSMVFEERTRVGAFDRFEPHGLSPAALDVIATRLAAHPAVQQAYLVEKHLRYSTGKQLDHGHRDERICRADAHRHGRRRDARR